MDLCHLRRAVPRHRRAARRSARSARTSASTSAGTASAGRPPRTSPRDHATEVREEEPDLLGIGVTPKCRDRAARPARAHPARQRAVGRGPAARRRRAGGDRRGGRHRHRSASPTRTSTPPTSTSPTPSTRACCSRAPTSSGSSAARTALELFDDRVDVLPGVTLARIGGHFDGAAVLHWAAGSEGRGALLTGDTITVVQDREWVSFMWSYPNLIPLDPDTIAHHRRPGRPVPVRPHLRRLVGHGWCSPTARARSAARPSATSPALDMAVRQPAAPSARWATPACAGPPRPVGARGDPAEVVAQAVEPDAQVGERGRGPGRGRSASRAPGGPAGGRRADRRGRAGRRRPARSGRATSSAAVVSGAEARQQAAGRAAAQQRLGAAHGVVARHERGLPVDRAQAGWRSVW